MIELLREQRETASLTQTDVSKRLGTYSTYITKIEAGERRIDVVELAEICELYGVKLQTLLKAAEIE